MIDHERRKAANQEAFDLLTGAEPTLVDVLPAGEVVPGYSPATILTSGPPLPWEEYDNGQRNAIAYGAMFEGLAGSVEEADQKFRSGELTVGACHPYGCIGSLAGIYSASMPVFVVENQSGGNRSFCNFYEGESRRRLNYGVYGDDVRDQLLRIEERLAPVIKEAVLLSGGIPLKPLMARALRLGDELHSRNTAATMLFSRELTPHLVEIASDRGDEVRETIQFLAESDYFFLRLSMAACKAATDAARDVEGSSMVVAMSLSCKEYGIQVSGLGNQWFRGPPAVVQGKFFEGFSEDDLVWMGGESQITETSGLGGFAQACAFPLQAYQGGTPQVMVDKNLEMYEITVGENPDYRIPFFGFRGTPTGIDVFKVMETGITPVIDAGLAGRDGGQIGAGTLRAPIECFEKALAAYEERYG
jgi:hypothetical protein